MSAIEPPSTRKIKLEIPKVPNRINLNNSVVDNENLATNEDLKAEIARKKLIEMHRSGSGLKIKLIRNNSNSSVKKLEMPVEKD
jgi:hypothetical protein